MVQAADHQANKPVIYLAFAQDRVEGGAYLRNLPTELDGIRKALQKPRQAGLCDVVERSNTTVENIFDVFQEYQDRIAIFHYGGHAGSYQLLLESLTGEHAAAHSEGLVSFLAKQKGLQLVFLNGCCSQQQALELIEAGLPAVIGTSQTIDDQIATSLSGRFYKGLAAGLSVQRAWAEAVDQVKVEKGTSNTRALHWGGKVDVSDRFPWDVYYRKDAETVKEWNLPAAANQPLFGLPLAEDYYRKLPRAPFVGVRDFQKEDAAIFFGRGPEIRKLYTQMTTGMQSIMLFYGKAGVGKSSVLQAGLVPRIENDYTVKYLHRLPEKGLAGTLLQALQELSDEYELPPVEIDGKHDLRAKLEALHKALDGTTGFARQVLESEQRKLTALAGKTPTFLEQWRLIEDTTQHPLVIILDQVNETCSSSMPEGGGGTDDLDSFLDTLRKIFEHDELRPRGKLILSYREEFHRTIREAFQAHSLSYAEASLEPLSWEAIVEAVEGVTMQPPTRDFYQLEVEKSKGSKLPEIIADDLLEGEDSPVAPILQILLTELWNAALREDAKAPRFTVRQYLELKQSGAILSGFVKQQLDRLHDWRNDVVDSGLTLDLLYRHTTAVGGAASLSAGHVREIYQDRKEIIERLLSKCRDLYLLTDVRLQDTRLAHHLLAPVVIKEYSISVKPGQQAARILNSKVEDFRTDEEHFWLNDADLEIVEKGKDGIRQLDAVEQRLLQKSREVKAKRERERKRNRVIRNVLVTVILFSAVVAWWEWQVAARNYRQSKANQLAFIAREVFRTDNTKALRIAQSAYDILGTHSPEAVTQTLSEIFHSQELTPFYLANFPHHAKVNSAVFSPDDKYILTASEDGTAKLWDQEGNVHQSFPHGNDVKAAMFSPNGKQILSLANNIVRLWELNGTLVDSDTLESGRQVDLTEFSTDGTRILTAFAGSEDERDRALIDRLKKDNYDVEFAPSRKRILKIRSYGGTVSLCEGEGTPLRDTIANNVVSVAFSSDGKKFLSVSLFGDSVSVVGFWDEDGDSLGEFRYERNVSRAVFSSDGRRILIASSRAPTANDPSTDHTARLWDFSHKITHRLQKHEGGVNAAVFSPDGQLMLTASHDQIVRIWDEHGNLLSRYGRLGTAVTSAIFSPDGKRILATAEDATSFLWVPGEDRAIKMIHQGEVKTAVYSPDGSRILTASLDSTARVWTADGAPIDTLRHPGEVLAAVFSPDGDEILTVAADSTARLWKANGDLIKTFRHRTEISSAVYSPDGTQILTVAIDSTARLWTVHGDLARTFRDDHPIEVAVFSTDGRRILTASSVVKIWDVQGKLLGSLAHAKPVNSVVFSPDGEQILTASADKSAKLWNLQGELVAHFESHSLPVNSAVFSPDGRRILTSSDDGYATIWWTPPAIDEWLKTAPVCRLTQREEEMYEILK